jgi:hypothetical protein
LAVLVQYVSPFNLIQVRLDGQFCKTKPVIVRQWPAAKRGDRFAAKIGRVGISRQPQRISTVTISMHKMSAGVFSQFLSSLSRLLDHAAVYAEVRKIDPSILLNARAPGGRGDQACDCRQEGLSGNAGSSVAGLQGLIG